VLVEGKKGNRREAEDVARKIYDELPKVLSPVTQTLIPATQTQQGNLTSPPKTKTANTPLFDYLRNF